MAAFALCVHGHFYQPPREDPLTGVIPSEPGAAPLGNWNERIHAECYRPNAESGNFEHLSFNFGPTLMSWMQTHDPATYSGIIAQDRRNVERFGVGNAIAQAYNHTILPLASHNDIVTQVAWGIADFRHRFGRAPQGMWLPETAVDTRTLAVMAEQGIEFTILAPWQANAQYIDTNEPYTVPLPNGRTMVVFFYHQDLSGRISFDPGLTSNADAFVARDLAPRLSYTHHGDRPALLMVASDGELYGHHQPFREMFLSHLLRNAGPQAGITTTFPARYLRDHPPRYSVTIRERTSWSCHHGVERWQDACGCTYNGNRWKAAMRHSLNVINDAVQKTYVATVQPHVHDVWELRNDYVQVLLGQQRASDFVRSQMRRAAPRMVAPIADLLAAQREMQRAFTSCGWFFDDFDRIEPKNNIQYAAQAIWLTRRATGVDLAPLAIQALSSVVSPRTGCSAEDVFRQHLRRTAATYRP